MARYILGRLLGLVFVLFAVSLITFLLTRAVPGDPFASGERELPEATQIARAAKYGFDQPILVQYGRYVWNVLHGDFGIPFQSPSQTVVDLIKQTWPVTMKIGALTILISYPLGILLGLMAALHRNSWIDYGVTFGSTLGMVRAELRRRHLADPPVQRWSRLVPDGRMGQSRSTRPAGDRLLLAADVAGRALHPGQHLESLARGPRAHGASEGACRAPGADLACCPQRTDPVRDDHASRRFPNILTGSIFIEQIFRVPGLGRFFVTSTLTRDYPMILALVLLVAVVWGITYLFTDILYTLLDPRIRLDLTMGTMAPGRVGDRDRVAREPIETLEGIAGRPVSKPAAPCAASSSSV